MSKKKVIIHSNFSRAFTGFGKHKKNLLRYLYKTGKYEIIELANARKFSDANVDTLPWKVYGSLPDDDHVLHKASQDPESARDASYGSLVIDELIEKEKPDIYLGIEDIWAFNKYTKKPWWNRVNCVIHTTLDSLPLIPEAISEAPNIKNYLVWASFAEKKLHELGHKHVKTVHGTLETDHFYRLDDERRLNLRNTFNLKDEFIIGFVFRNQLRKSVPNLLDGFKIFKEKYGIKNSKLLLHTNWLEGWDIPRLIQDAGVNPDDVLTTIVCNQCSNYAVTPFLGPRTNCPFCQSKGSMATVSIDKGVDEGQLNEIYNLMDVYCHPFTSGGQEIPIQEAKLAELITLVTNYSCGEDAVKEGSGGIPLSWSAYREPGTQFIKATTDENCIADKLLDVYKMDPKTKRRMEKKSRQYVINNFSIEVVGKYFEDLFDSFKPVDWEVVEKKCVEKRNENYIPPSNLNPEEWILDLYTNMLKYDGINRDDSGFKYWMNEIRAGKSKGEILKLFKDVAIQENSELFKPKISEMVDDNGRKRLAFVYNTGPEEIVLSIGVVKALKKKYPDYDIYYFTNKLFFHILDEVDEIYKLCEVTEEIRDCFSFEGVADKPGHFDLAYMPEIDVNHISLWAHHGKDK